MLIVFQSAPEPRRVRNGWGLANSISSEARGLGNATRSRSKGANQSCDDQTQLRQRKTMGGKARQSWSSRPIAKNAVDLKTVLDLELLASLAV
jgi:hypothetical protein